MYILKVKSYKIITKCCNVSSLTWQTIVTCWGNSYNFPTHGSRCFHILTHVECNLLLPRATEIHGSELTPVVITQDTGRIVRINKEKGINKGGKKSSANFR